MARVYSFSIFSVVGFMFSVSIGRTRCDIQYSTQCAISDFDYYNLTVATWYITLDQQKCLSVNQTQAATQCTVVMAFCHSVGGSGLCQNSSVCSTSVQGNISLGAYRQDPFSALATPSSNGFQAVFSNGSQYTSTGDVPCLLQTDIVFLCNHSATWATSGAPGSRTKALDPKSVSYNSEVCQLSLTFDYAGACRQELPSSESLSAGTVLTVIFFVTLILYFVFGSMINIARGRVGSGMVPHSNFWTMLPIYIVDGCQFAFCCGRLPVTAAYEEI